MICICVRLEIKLVLYINLNDLLSERALHRMHHINVAG